jgi:hypothetical protein
MKTLCKVIKLSFGLLLLLVFISGCSELKPIPEGVKPYVVRGEIVQAYFTLYLKREYFNNAALIVFSLNSSMSTNDLKKLAHFAFSLKDSKPVDPDQALLAKEVTNESYIPNYFWKVPRSICGNDDTYLAHMWIERQKLTEHYLRSNASLQFSVYFVEGKPYTARLIGDIIE